MTTFDLFYFSFAALVVFAVYLLSIPDKPPGGLE